MRYAHGEKALSGIAVPLSALRSAASPGCGEFPDLLLLGELAESWGLGLVQLLPVNDSGNGTSPYSALSAFALHPLYLRIGELPELASGLAGARAKRQGFSLPAESAAAFLAESEALARRFGAAARVPHEELLAAKLVLLEKIWQERRALIAARKADGELDAWIASSYWIKDYAAFTVLKKRAGGLPWWEWPSARDPDAALIQSLWVDTDFISELRFVAWLQLRCHEQFQAAAESLSARGIELMGDLPILLGRDSAEVWARRGLFRLDRAAGAPPDMYSSLGQNWGFPVYDWEAMEAEDFSFWKQRLKSAEPYYSTYRIDHVLGFFRLWTLGDREDSGYLGRFDPSVLVTRAELESVGFSAERIRWISLPHVPGAALLAAAGEQASRAARREALERIGGEELFLFKASIRGERDIESLPGLSPAARDYLVARWRDRVLLEDGKEGFSFTWTYRDSSAWGTLSAAEKQGLESLAARKAASSESIWEEQGRRLLGMLKRASSMLPCAEDLGAVPASVPLVLEELRMLGLRVLRWARRWDEAGQPYVPVSEYPELSVACPSVHDSSSLRGWWDSEADRGQLWDFAARSLGRDLGPCPGELGSADIAVLLELVAAAASRIAVYPFQDLLALSETLRPANSAAERVNVPGTTMPDNWSYRMPIELETLLHDPELASAIKKSTKRAATASPRAETTASGADKAASSGPATASPRAETTASGADKAASSGPAKAAARVKKGHGKTHGG